MDNPRLAFFFDEISFWRLVSVLVLITLLISAMLMMIIPRLDGMWGEWSRIPVDIHARIPVDYQYHMAEDLLPLKSQLLQEIENSP